MTNTNYYHLSPILLFADLTKEIVNRLIEQAKKQIKEKGIGAELEKLKAKAKEEEADPKLEEEKKVEDKLKGLFK